MPQAFPIPQCHKLSIRYHYYLDFSMKMSKKKLDTQMSQIKHHMSVSYGFPWKCHKKLDTQMSSTKHPSSPPNAAEAHVEPCTELSTDSTEKCPFSKVKQYEIARDFFPPNPSAAKKRLDFWSIRWLCKVTSICPRHLQQLFNSNHLQQHVVANELLISTSVYCNHWITDSGKTTLHGKLYCTACTWNAHKPNFYGQL